MGKTWWLLLLVTAEANGTFTIISNDPDDPQISIPMFASVIADADNDGFNSIESGGTDCNDSDPSINPEAIDEWYDGVDSDCAENDDYDFTLQSYLQIEVEQGE